LDLDGTLINPWRSSTHERATIQSYLPKAERERTSKGERCMEALQIKLPVYGNAKKFVSEENIRL